MNNSFLFKELLIKSISKYLTILLRMLFMYEQRKKMCKAVGIGMFGVENTPVCVNKKAKHSKQWGKGWITMALCTIQKCVWRVQCW
jgi:hypothetical protein